jgi:hypothetical protein
MIFSFIVIEDLVVAYSDMGSQILISMIFHVKKVWIVIQHVFIHVQCVHPAYITRSSMNKVTVVICLPCVGGVGASAHSITSLSLSLGSLSAGLSSVPNFARGWQMARSPSIFLLIV